MQESDLSELRRANDFIKNVDKDFFENHFIVWSSSMLNGDGNQDGILQAISAKSGELESYLQGMVDSDYDAKFETNDFKLDDRPNKLFTEIMRRNMQHEIVVNDIILRVFNKRPDIYI